MPSAPGAIDPRLDRADASVSVAQAEAGGGALTVPRTRLWGWMLEVAQQQRTTRVSPPFIGPAMILEMYFRQPHANNIRNWSLFWSVDDGGTLTGGLPGVRPSGTPIWETHTHSSSIATPDLDEITENFPNATQAGDPTYGTVWRPRFIIPYLGRFFLKVTAGGGSAGGGTYWGNITVVEAGTFEQLANFS